MQVVFMDIMITKVLIVGTVIMESMFTEINIRTDVEKVTVTFKLWLMI